MTYGFRRVTREITRRSYSESDETSLVTEMKEGHNADVSLNTGERNHAIPKKDRTELIQAGRPTLRDRFGEPFDGVYYD